MSRELSKTSWILPNFLPVRALEDDKGQEEEDPPEVALEAHELEEDDDYNNEDRRGGRARKTHPAAAAAAGTEDSDRTLPSAFQCPRHLEKIRPPETFTYTWRARERMKTVSVALVLCLNVGVDPPDVCKAQPCARVECWIDPQTLKPARDLVSIGDNLQAQYERWQPRARYRQCLDPTVEDVRRLTTNLRKNARDDRVLFHYNGHGVPKPTANGEIWVFNRTYTQYIPLSLYELQSWMGSPSIFVYDCSCAGIILNTFERFSGRRGREYMEQVNSQGISSSDLPPPVSQRNCIQLGACSATEVLPMNPELPADLFTSCLTTPIKMVLQWFVMQNQGRLAPNITIEMLDKIPGVLGDRRTMLGELNWIFTAITDTIAWNTLNRELFLNLFRQDLLVAALFRNFLLAERIMRSYDCTPVSSPELPPTHQHPMWQAWDLAVDMCLSQLPGIIEKGKTYVPSSFFEEQLTAFQVWLKYGRDNRKPPEQLPIVLQVLLSQAHRLRALDLLSRFLDLGPWAVNLSLHVGIFPYVLKLLQSTAKELRPLLVSIWAKILPVDSGCQTDLIREGCHRYFLSVLQDPTMKPKIRTGAAFVLASVVNNYEPGQTEAEKANLIPICLEQIDANSNFPLLRQWLAIALGRVWEGYEPARWRGARDNAHEKLYELLTDPEPGVRAAAVFALGTFIHATEERTPHADSIDHKIAQYLLNAVSEDASPMVRMELVVALQWIVFAFEPNFLTICKSEVAPLISTSSSTNALNRVGLLPASASSPALDHLDKHHNKAFSLVVSFGGGVYNKIYAGLVHLSHDPFDKVAKMAKEIIVYLKQKAAERDHQSGLMRTSSVLTTIASASTSAENSENNNSSSVPSSPAVSFLLGSSPPSSSSNNTPKLNRSLPDNKRKTTVIFEDATAASTLPRLSSSSRQHHNAAAPSSLQHLNLLSSNSSSSSNSTKKAEPPDLKTDFLQWSAGYFMKQLMEHDPASEAVDDCESLEHWEREWLFKRNEQVRLKAAEQRERLTKRSGKIDEQQSLRIRNPEVASALGFHPYDNHIAVGSVSGVNVYDVPSGVKIAALVIKHNHKLTKVTAIHFINAHEKPLLLTGSDDGSLRIWRNYNDPDKPLELVTAWFAFKTMKQTFGSVGLRVTWEAKDRCLAVGGEARSIRLWDAEKELIIAEWSTVATGGDSYLSALSCTPSSPGLFAGGFGDGSVRVFDKRVPHGRVMMYREHDRPILDLKMRGSIDGSTTPGQIISGSSDGDVRFFEPRATSSCRLISVGSSISSLSIHERAQVVAAWTSSQQCAIHSLQKNGPLINVLKYHDGILGQRLGNVKAIVFHPHLLTLAVATKGSVGDSIITSFGFRSTTTS